jgi:hypothetical protein
LLRTESNAIATAWFRGAPGCCPLKTEGEEKEEVEVEVEDEDEELIGLTFTIWPVYGDACRPGGAASFAMGGVEEATTTEDAAAEGLKGTASCSEK